MRSHSTYSSATASRQTTWILCRNQAAFPIANDAELLRCAERGRLRPDDYLVNPRLDTCVQAREMVELKVIFRKKTIQRLEKVSWLLAWGWQQFSG
jgi:hypothetical protein